MSLNFSCDIQMVGSEQHESMDPSCLVSPVQAAGGGVMVWGIFSWHTLGSLVPIEHHLNATPCWIYATKNKGSSEGKRGPIRY